MYGGERFISRDKSRSNCNEHIPPIKNFTFAQTNLASNVSLSEGEGKQLIAPP